MKKLPLLLLLIAIFVVPACSTSAQTPIPTVAECAKSEAEAADDIVYTPGGPAYRGNFHQEGVTNPWPTISANDVFLGDSDNEFLFYLLYRDYIETRAGEARNNILYLQTPEKDVIINSIELYTSGTPSKINVVECMRYSGPLFRFIPVLSIEIAEDAAPGEYMFEIGFIINDTDYGMVPCTIKVID